MFDRDSRTEDTGLNKEGSGCGQEDDGAAVVSFESFNPALMHEGHTCDSPLVGVGYTERVDPLQLHEGRVCDGHLAAVNYVELLDPA